ncbi:MAG: hypothetical protein K9L30_17640 [Desulfobacterales bacterium]|nr:hypothetical protein [Desulfobacterales bacterium]
MEERKKGITKLQIDNDRVMVHNWRLAPGAETGWHRHEYDYVVIPLMTGKLLLETRSGDNSADLEKGRPYFRNAGVEHNTVNSNDFEFTFVEVELK